MAVAANDIITVVEAKAYLNEAGSSFDTILQTLITAISTMFDRYARSGNSLVKATDTTLKLHGTGRPTLLLPRWPVVSIASIKENDTTLVEGDDEDYVIDSNIGAVDRMNGGTWSKGTQNIILTSFVAGYVASGTGQNMPEDLRLACMKQVAYELQQYKRKDWGETSRSLPDGSYQRVASGLLPEVKQTLDHYRRIRV
jgi:uncharacterized phiE125 gp8 family phage protein